jgi:hypothetical protein
MTDLTEPEQAQSTVAFWVQQGVTSSKAYMNITEAVLVAAIDESHRQHIKITGHLCAVDYHQAAALGIDNLEHGPVYTDTEFVPGRKHDTCPSGGEFAASWQNLDIDSPQVQAMMHDLIKRNVAITSTLPVFEAMIPTRQPLSEHQMESMSGESLRSYLNERTKDLVVVKGNPGTHIEDIENVELVFKDGMAYDPAKLIGSVRGMVGVR